MEVLVSFAVLTIVSIAAIAAIANMVSLSSDTNIRITAANVAQSDLAEQRAITDRTTVAAISSSTPVTRTEGGRKFWLWRSVTGPGGTAQTCGKGHDKNYTPAWIDVTDTVSWTNSHTSNANGRTSLTVGTRLAC